MGIKFLHPYRLGVSADKGDRRAVGRYSRAEFTESHACRRISAD